MCECDGCCLVDVGVVVGDECFVVDELVMVVIVLFVVVGVWLYLVCEFWWCLDLMWEWWFWV